MEYILYAHTNDTISKIGERVLDILRKDNIFGEVGGIIVKGNEMSCYCDVFTLVIDTSSDTIKCVAEESKLSLNIEFYMNLNTQCEDVVVKTISFVGGFLKNFLGNIVLMQNGDTPIVIRKGDDVIVDTSKVPACYPFEELKTKYQVSKLEF